MSEWKEYTIGELCDSVSDSYKRNDKQVILINTSDVLNGKVLNHSPAPNENLKGQFRKTFRRDDILYSEIRPANKRFAYIDFDNTENYIASSKLMVLRPHREIVLSRFLYNVLKSPEIINKLQQLAETRSGTFPQITFLSELAPMRVKIPDFETQCKIASVLSALDDKIELNRKINQNLEEQAQAIFENSIVNATKNGVIGNYCSVKSGYAFKSSWWIDDGVQVVKIKNITNGFLNLTDCSYVSLDKIEIAKEFLVTGGDVLIAMTGATIGKFSVVPKYDKPILVNQRVGRFLLGNNPIERLPFLFCTLKLPDIMAEIINRGQGSAQPNISATDIMTTPCYIPDNNIITYFNNMCKPIFESIISRQQENQRLSAMRDALLPKLMSGEIDVSDVKI
ncbi:MAG: restriction endonuclease subunit S [Ruminococcus sp.]|nr:restriction endonuclease subunit S [Ruminococcus sp.]